MWWPPKINQRIGEQKLNIASQTLVITTFAWPVGRQLMITSLDTIHLDEQYFSFIKILCCSHTVAIFTSMSLHIY